MSKWAVCADYAACADYAGGRHCSGEPVRPHMPDFLVFDTLKNGVFRPQEMRNMLMLSELRAGL
jgi:hypothetical protein